MYQPNTHPLEYAKDSNCYLTPYGKRWYTVEQIAEKLIAGSCKTPSVLLVEREIARMEGAAVFIDFRYATRGLRVFSEATANKILENIL